jgi:hypothetical protein
MSEQKHRTKKSEKCGLGVSPSRAPFQEKDSTEKKKIYLAMDRTQWKDRIILMIAISFFKEVCMVVSYTRRKITNI